jgi:hypothetical protein
VLCALALLQLSEDTSAPQIARVVPLTPQAIRRAASEGKSRTARVHVFEESDSGTMCAEQRVAQAGRSPSGARMRSVISERGGNAPRAGEGGRYG